MKASSIGFNPEYAEDAPELEQIVKLTGDALLEFGTPWCGHCQAAQPVVREVMQEHPSLAHIKVYDGKGKHLGREFRVKLWPTLILLQDGSEVARLVRPADANQIRTLIAQASIKE